MPAYSALRPGPGRPAGVQLSSTKRRWEWYWRGAGPKLEGHLLSNVGERALRPGTLGRLHAAQLAERVPRIPDILHTHEALLHKQKHEEIFSLDLLGHRRCPVERPPEVVEGRGLDGPLVGGVLCVIRLRGEGLDEAPRHGGKDGYPNQHEERHPEPVRRLRGHHVPEPDGGQRHHGEVKGVVHAVQADHTLAYHNHQHNKCGQKAHQGT
mmetsp:Transcript_25580/g.79808  ORF Transcript_25580/g.79808 Transcript_25580/m.79808 type:complete len:210 (+) Transcript_25580:69-698(+)